MTEGMNVKKIPASRPSLGAAERSAVLRVLESSRLAGSGPEVAAFEEECSEWLHVENAVAVSSGTAALYLALSQCVSPGDVVVTSPLTFFATVEAILMLGCRPVFADVNCRGQMDAVVAVNLMRTTPGVRAICPVHMYGDMVGMGPIVQAAAELGVSVVEDACQAHGAEDHGCAAGTFGDFGCLSFYATKHITTLGEGGLVVCRDRDAAARLRAARSHGMTEYSTHMILGWNWRMSEAAAAVGRAQLARFPAIQEHRARQSMRIWADVEGLGWVMPILPGTGVTHGFFWLPILLDPRVDCKAFKAHMANRGIEIRHRYSVPVYHQPIVARTFGQRYVEEQSAACPAAEALAPRIVGLPTCSHMTDKEVARIVEAMRAFTP